MEANRQERDQPSVLQHDEHQDCGHLEHRAQGQQDRPAPRGAKEPDHPAAYGYLLVPLRRQDLEAEQPVAGSAG